MRTVLFLLILIFCSSIAHTETIELEKYDYIKLIIGTYVHGFKEFDTTVVSSDKSVSVGIYYDLSTQSKERANQIARRFRHYIPIILGDYEWGKGIEVWVSVYSEDRSGRGY